MNGAVHAASSSQSRILKVWNAVKSPNSPLNRAPVLLLHPAGLPGDEQSVENQVRNRDPASTIAPTKPISSELCRRLGEKPPFLSVASAAIPAIRTLTPISRRGANPVRTRHE